MREISYTKPREQSNRGTASNPGKATGSTRSTLPGFVHKNGELTAALLCGLLIACAYVFPVVSTPLFIAAFMIGGFAKAREGITDLVFNRRLNVEILMILAAIGAGMIGYWGEGAILILIFAASGALETYTLNKSEQDLTGLMQLQPEEAALLGKGGEQTNVSVSDLQIDDRILVKPGERIPIDGRVVQGVSTVDESPITGEFVPVEKSSGHVLFAGTMNGSGSLVMQVTKRNMDTLFQKIVRLVEQAQAEKAPAQQFIERFEKIYVKAVLSITLLMMFLPHYAFGWSWEETWYRALVLLVVASPCALVASISPAVLSVLSYSARNGVLIKGGSYIERMAGIKAVAVDKTGTVTTGRPQVTDVYVRPGKDEAELWRTVAGLECQSAHPLAQAIVHHVRQKGIAYEALENMRDVSGKGVCAIRDGEKWSVGSARFVGEHESRRFREEQVSDFTVLQGKTVVYVRDGAGVAALIALQDGVREEARQAIRQLDEHNIEVVMITGDQETVARSIAEQAGIRRFTAEALPDEKMHLVEALRRQYGPVAMIGDGINDAPSLAKADIGVAMGAGTDIALDSADMVLVQNNLQKIADSIRVSKKMNRIIKQNVYFSLSVITVLIAANFLQSLSLPLGVIGHEGSTILVILNGLRLLRG